MMVTNPNTSSPAKSGLAYLDYLIATWLPEPLWRSWSQFGRLEAATILGKQVNEVAPTTNHLESFNGVLKRKYIRGYQRGGRRLRFDLLIFLLVTRILPSIFEHRKTQTAFYNWLSQRFTQYAGGQNLVKLRDTPTKSKSQVTYLEKKHEFTWWTEDGWANFQDEVEYIIKQRRIGQLKWINPYTIAAICASSVEDIRLLSHKRYTLLMNCYGWAACSCLAFERFGSACKHLWAFQLIVEKMQTPFSFIFPNSEDDAGRIYTSLFVPGLPMNSSGQETQPQLIDQALRPCPLPNLIGCATVDINEIIKVFDENQGASVEGSIEQGITVAKLIQPEVSHPYLPSSHCMLTKPNVSHN